MLFHSFIFLFVFLPLTILAHRLALRLGGAGAAMAALTVASLTFYGWWNPPYLAVILGSILGNFCLGSLIRKSTRKARKRRARALTGLGIGANLLTLGYFKYWNFFLDNAHAIFGATPAAASVVLPIGISFFTFQQIAYLVDNYQRPIPDASFIRYTLFVTFFPQLIAGPIVHHREMMPQFRHRSFARPAFSMIAAGLFFLAAGLFKKLALADNLSPVVGQLFEEAARGKTLEFWQSWTGAFAYSLQIYFDFSGYSDMAIGLGLLFGIRLPVNFFSPYKATGYIDFWRRWHITLSRFLRDYLYIPLGGNRRGPARRYVNLLLTMLIGGLWHGAAWTFVLWGGLHGLFLALNHGWHHVRPPLGFIPGWIRRGVAGAVTFASLTALWIFFRAPDFAQAGAVLRGMGGMNGSGWARKPSFIAALERATDVGPLVLALMLASLVLVWAAPNTIEIARIVLPGEPRDIQSARQRRAWIRFRPSWGWAVGTGLLAAAAFWAAPEISEFIYFQF